MLQKHVFIATQAHPSKPQSGFLLKALDSLRGWAWLPEATSDLLAMKKEQFFLLRM